MQLTICQSSKYLSSENICSPVDLVIGVGTFSKLHDRTTTTLLVACKYVTVTHSSSAAAAAPTPHQE